MKIKVICCLSLLLTIGSLAAAQQVGPCGQPTGTASANWLQYHFDPCHTGYNPNEVILSPSTVGNLVLDWQCCLLPVIRR